MSNKNLPPSFKHLELIDVLGKLNVKSARDFFLFNVVHATRLETFKMLKQIESDLYAKRVL